MSITEYWIEKGIEKGKDELSSLIKCLMKQGKYSEVQKVLDNPEYREKLLKAYGITE